MPQTDKTKQSSPPVNWMDGEPVFNPAALPKNFVKESDERKTKAATTTLGRKLPLKTDAEKKGREQYIAKNPSKWRLDDWTRLGIKTPGLENNVIDDPIAMATMLATAPAVAIGGAASLATRQFAKTFLRQVASESTLGISDIELKKLFQKLKSKHVYFDKEKPFLKDNTDLKDNTYINPKINPKKDIAPIPGSNDVYENTFTTTGIKYDSSPINPIDNPSQVYDKEFIIDGKTDIEEYKKFYSNVYNPNTFGEPTSDQLNDFIAAHKDAIKNMEKITGTAGTKGLGGKEMGLEIRNILANKYPQYESKIVLTKEGSKKYVKYDYTAPLQDNKFISDNDIKIENLTPQDNNIINAYSKGYDNSINGALRSTANSETNLFYQKAGNDLKKATLKHKFKNPTQVHRGIIGDYGIKLYDNTGKVTGSKLRSELAVGDIFMDEGFLSTSFNKGSTWGDAHLNELIDIPGGSKQSLAVPNASSYSEFSNEQEAILPPGLKRRVLEVGAVSDNAKFRTEILNPYNYAIPALGGYIANKNKTTEQEMKSGGLVSKEWIDHFPGEKWIDNHNEK